MYKVAYEEGKRLVDDQLAELDSMRQRSVQFLAFVGSATAFLVGTGLTTPTRDTWFFILASSATFLSLSAILMVLAVLVSSRRLSSPAPYEFDFRVLPGKLVEWIEPEVPQPDEVDFLRALANQYQSMYEHNEQGLKLVRKYYLLFIVMGFLQLSFWVSLAWMNG